MKDYSFIYYVFSNDNDWTKLFYLNKAINDNHSQKGDMVMAKTISFAIVHFSVAFTVGYLLTGSILFGSVMAMVEPAINTVAFYFHEKIWNHLQQNKVNPSVQLTRPAQVG